MIYKIGVVLGTVLMLVSGALALGLLIGLLIVAARATVLLLGGGW